MPEGGPPTDYVSHGVYTDPGEQGALILTLPSDVENLCRVVQGLLVHDHYRGLLYGNPTLESLRDDCPPSRETLPVAQRLGNIMATHTIPLHMARPVFERAVGTCRDFALLLCAMLRHHGTPARLRCGFADYFSTTGFEDHWLVQYWRADKSRWMMADAQLDDAHCRHLDINIPIIDVPEDQFLPATTAWQMVRDGHHDVPRFGHGDDTGEWFLHINLMRDVLSLQGLEVSAWDTWRDAPNGHRQLDDETRALCDRVAALAESPPITAYMAKPSWQK